MRVEVLYPEICNLFGDTMNAEFLRQCGAEIVKTSLKQRPRFLDGGIDLVYMGAMTESAQERAIAALMPHAGQIRESVENGQTMLTTGNASELFGKEILCDDGRAIPALGVFGYWAKRQLMNRYNAVYLGKFGDVEIVGFKSQFSHTFGCEGYDPLFETVRGDGWHPGISGEGVRYRNFFGTYLIGPLRPLNPPFAKALMHTADGKEHALAFEQEAVAVYEKRVKEFNDPKTRIKF